MVEQGTPLDWSSTGNTDYLVSNGSSANFLPATEGTQLFYFFFGVTTEAISQGAIALTAGQSYLFSFDLSRIATLSPGTVRATLSDGSDSQMRSFFSVSADAWTHETWEFTAADSADFSLMALTACQA